MLKAYIQSKRSYNCITIELLVVAKVVFHISTMLASSPGSVIFLNAHVNWDGTGDKAIYTMPQCLTTEFNSLQLRSPGCALTMA